MFKRHHINLIRWGIKTKTRRFWKTPHAIPGKVHAAKTSYYQRKADSPLIVIMDVYKEELGKMDDEEAFREGGYTLPQFKKVLEKVSKIVWDDRLRPYVVEFFYIGEGEEYYGVE